MVVDRWVLPSTTSSPATVPEGRVIVTLVCLPLDVAGVPTRLMAGGGGCDGATCSRGTSPGPYT